MATITICDQCNNKVDDRDTLIQLDISVPDQYNHRQDNTLTGEVCTAACALKWLAIHTRYHGVLIVRRDFRGNTSFDEPSIHMVQAALDQASACGITVPDMTTRGRE